MESKSFPGRLQRNRCKRLSLPAAEPTPQQPASPVASLTGRCGTLHQVRGESEKDSARRLVLNSPAQTTRARATQQCRGRTEADPGSGRGSSRYWLWQQVLAVVAHAEAGGEAYRNLNLTEALWKYRGHPHGTAQNIKASLPAMSAGAHSSIYIPPLLKKNPTPKRHYLLSTKLDFSSSFPALFIFVKTYRMGKERG